MIKIKKIIDITDMKQLVIAEDMTDWQVDINGDRIKRYYINQTTYSYRHRNLDDYKNRCKDLFLKDGYLFCKDSDRYKWKISNKLREIKNITNYLQYIL